MPCTIETVEVVYTLEELQELDQRGYEKAIEAITEWSNNDYWYIEMVGESLLYMLEEEKELSNVKVTGWDYDRPWNNNFTADLDVAAYMKERKLHVKYRALWYAMHVEGFFYTSIGIDGIKVGQLSHALEEWEAELYRYTDLYEEDRPRYDRLIAQIREVGAAISCYVSDLLGQMQKTVRAEIEYRWSEEFAKEEAEALELHFNEEGKIVHI